MSDSCRAIPVVDVRFLSSDSCPLDGNALTSMHRSSIT